MLALIRRAKALAIVFVTDRVVKFHTSSFAQDQPGFPQDLEMLRKGRFWDNPVTDLKKGGASLWSLGLRDFRRDVHQHRIGQCAQYQAQ